MRISDWSSDVCSSDLGARAYAFGYRFDLRHPLADEVAFCQWGRVAGVSRYAAATGMAQHHDVLDLQRVHAKLDGGAGAVKRSFGIGLAGRDKVGDIADYKYLAGIRIKDGFGGNTRVAATNDHNLWVLSGFG